MPRNSAAYDDDFFAWTQEQARLLRNGELSQLDVENVAEELESMGRRDKRELDSRLEVLLTHLLKWHLQVQMRSPSWSGTIREQRRRIKKLLRESPSLNPAVAELLPEVYVEAREWAGRETGLIDSAFPAECPFTPEQILSEDFLPE
ncbi:MAG TPA: DUF29 domain-containing protein [Stellaceae bacterium]|jgi:hypothetical protein|nr:DUF29 domain-containing protein [Stellaceae bacterium]